MIFPGCKANTDVICLQVIAKKEVMQEIHLWVIHGQVLISNRSHRASIIRCSMDVLPRIIMDLSNKHVREATINKILGKIGKHLCCSHSLTKLQVCSPQLY